MRYERFRWNLDRSSFEHLPPGRAAPAARLSFIATLPSRDCRAWCAQSPRSSAVLHSFALAWPCL